MARKVELVRRIGLRVLAAGGDVAFDPGWERRGATTFDPRGHTDHHTGTVYDVRRILREGHGRLPGPLCNFSIERDGLLVVIAAGRANHAGRGGYRGLTGNGSVLGTEITGDGLGFTDAQVATNDRLHVALAQEGIDVWLQHSHAEWAGGRKHDAAGPPHGAPEPPPPGGARVRRPQHPRPVRVALRGRRAGAHRPPAPRRTGGRRPGHGRARAHAAGAVPALRAVPRAQASGLMVPQEDAGGVWVSTRTIYDKLLEVEGKVDRLLEHDLPPRVRSLELWRYGIPANALVTIVGVVAALAKS